MNKTTVALLHNSIAEEALLAKAQTWQKGYLSVPVTAEFAALFCTARQPEQCGTSAEESLSSAVESRKRAVERLTPCNGKLVFTIANPHVSSDCAVQYLWWSFAASSDNDRFVRQREAVLRLSWQFTCLLGTLRDIVPLITLGGR